LNPTRWYNYKPTVKDSHPRVKANAIPERKESYAKAEELPTAGRENRDADVSA